MFEKTMQAKDECCYICIPESRQVKHMCAAVIPSLENKGVRGHEGVGHPLRKNHAQGDLASILMHIPVAHIRACHG